VPSWHFAGMAKSQQSCCNNSHTYIHTYIHIQICNAHRKSVSRQNQRHGQSLVVHGGVESGGKIKSFKMALTEGELRLFKGIAFQVAERRNRRHDDLLMCRLRVLLVSGYAVNEESGWVDRYLVNYEGIQVDRRLGFYR